MGNTLSGRNPYQRSRWRRRPELPVGGVCFVVYRHPVEYVEGYVVRWFEVHSEYLNPRDCLGAARHLYSVRAEIPPRVSHRLDRLSDDHPAILEIWY